MICGLTPNIRSPPLLRLLPITVVVLKIDSIDSIRARSGADGADDE